MLTAAGFVSRHGTRGGGEKTHKKLEDLNPV
jgi:hypothetical protein